MVRFRRNIAFPLLVVAIAAEPVLAAAGGDPVQAAERAAQDAARAQERGAQDAARAQERAVRDAARAEERATREAAVAAERTARAEQRFTEERAKIAADAERGSANAARDLAKAEADYQRALAEAATSGSSNSGSGSSNSGSSGTSGSNSGSNSGSSGSSGSSDKVSSAASTIASPTDSVTSSNGSAALRELAREEAPDFDARGFPARHGEVVALDLGDGDLEAVGASGFRVIARDRLESLSGTVTRLGIPAGVDAEQALLKLRAIAADAAFDYVHYYGLAPQGGPPASSAGVGAGAAPAVLGHKAGSLVLGMIDTAVAAHPALNGTSISRWPSGSKQGASVQHGTAVASILASEGARRLLVADVFRGSEAAPYTSADAIVQSLEWMAENRVGVVNISLAGPRNAILDRLIRRATEHGMVIVAAAGNGGPAAPPAYPAALDAVVAVTAVDARSHIYRYANQGDYIAVAAKGVDEPAAIAGGGVARFSGTSFATPHIAAWIARCLAGKRSTSSDCRNRLHLAARDAGTPGRDPVYGWGIVDSR